MICHARMSEAGIQKKLKILDSRLRGNDNNRLIHDEI
jgi:hypothetical protein